jgi:hypothetical protein
MSKPEWCGLAVLLCGAVVGFLLGGTFGLALAGVCLVVGFVLLVASEALGTRPKPTDAKASSQSVTHLLVMMKEVHARTQRAGKFQEITGPDQSGLDFEIFVHCWLVNDTDGRLGIAATRLTLTKPGGTPVQLARIAGDLQHWKLGRLRDELDSWGERYLQAAQELMSELHIEEPLEGGASRAGWMHLRAEGLTPAQMQNARLELEVIDSQLASHFGQVNGPHLIPGRVWPFRGEASPVPAAGLPDRDRRQPFLGGIPSTPSN